MGETLDRVLCGDDMCTGLYGSDGRCGTCGRGVHDDDPPTLRAEVAALMAAAAGEDGVGQDEGEVGARRPAAPEETPERADTTEPTAAVATTGEAATASGAASDLVSDAREDDPREDDPREPCADDMCTGIYNAQGVCGTCGRAKG